MKSFQLLPFAAAFSVAVSPAPFHFANSTIEPSTNVNTPMANDTGTSAQSNTTIHVNSKVRNGIECGPGNGVWLLATDFYPLVDEFCMSVEGNDISDGYSASDTYLVSLTPQDGGLFGNAGKVIFAIKNSGERPAYHLRYWVDDCATQLRALMDTDCYGKNGDTKGGTNNIGNIVFEATIKEGDTW